MLISLSRVSSRIVLAILFEIFTTCIGLTKQNKLPPPLITRLIHHHSIYSPHFNQQTTTAERADFDLQTSIARAAYLVAGNSSTNLLHTTTVEAQLVPWKQHGFQAYLEVGEKLTGQLVIMDTASSLLWINCEPCGLNVPGPLYHPIESPTYKIENCEQSQFCSTLLPVRTECGKDNRCDFQVRYGTSTGGKKTMGYLAKETFKFGRSAETLEGIVFGCANYTDIFTNGVLGLGMNRISLSAQRSSTKFAYCIGNISDIFYPFNTLAIGDQIELVGAQTPLIIEDKYYITLEGIIIDGEPLEIDYEIFKRKSDYTGGMVVDSASTMTFIPEVAYQEFRMMIADMMGFMLVQNGSFYYGSHQRLCYNGNLYRDLNEFAMVQLFFKGPAVMELSMEHVFQQVTDQNFCLAILPSEPFFHTSMSLLGILMQQYFYVSYDIRERIFAFQKMECDSVDDYIHEYR